MDETGKLKTELIEQSEIMTADVVPTRWGYFCPECGIHDEIATEEVPNGKIVSCHGCDSVFKLQY